MPELPHMGKRKAAIALMALGPEASANIMRGLSDEQIEELTLEIASLGRIDPNEKRTVLEEFYQTAQASEFASRGGMDQARELLEKAVGSERSLEILGRLQGSLQDIPFEFIRKADATQVVNFIQDEHPQTIALILAHLPHKTSALVVSELPVEVQADVIRRIATMDRTPPEVIREIEKVLERRIASVFTQDFTFAGGSQDVAEILNLVDRATERNILGTMEESDPELAEEIKKLMFVFDNMVLVDDAGIQKVLREIENKDLVLALKAASQDVIDKIFRNMSERAREVIKEEMEYMGPVRLRNVEEAQQKVVAAVRRLEQAGELIISGRGGQEDEIVV